MLDERSLAHERDDRIKVKESMMIARRYPDVNFILGGKGYESAAQLMYPDWVMKEPADKWQDWFEKSPYFR